MSTMQHRHREKIEAKKNTIIMRINLNKTTPALSAAEA